MEYFFHIALMLNIYIILVLSTNVTIMANLLTLCQAAFYGIGAYLATFFLLQFELPMLVIAICVMGLSGLCSILITIASVKLKGDYFILATLGFQMVVYTILYNWIDITNGPFGISGIPSLRILGIWELHGVYAYFTVSAIAVAALIILFAGLRNSPYGRSLRSLRSDEQSLAALGRNVSFLKGSAFFISAAFAGLAGMLYASYSSYIDPTSFTLSESLFIISALFIGGIGNISGPILGALFVVILPEILRFIGLPESIAAPLRQIIYGLSLVLVMYFRPQGIGGKVILK
ncbi:MAG: branched-chain amino acid ABC transporter permease [Paludibacteraceae bacterium]|nr:branched-chain amino acid ABC transporter permease [Paludibacteraceae bacterium]